MSSVKYSDKPLEEMQNILKSYEDNHLKQFGISPESAVTEQKIRALISQKKEEFFLRTFSDLSPKNLRDCCELLTKKEDKRPGFKKSKG